jgi:hypothetical protein
MIGQLPATSEKLLAFKMSGKLHDEDYKRFVPLIDAVAAKEGIQSPSVARARRQGWVASPARASPDLELGTGLVGRREETLPPYRRNRE